MKTRKDVIDYCLTLKNVYEDYPFHDFNWTVMRHMDNKKMFAAIYKHMGCIWINVKCDPNLTYMWRDAFRSVVPAYHMNKYHWNSIMLDGTVPDADIKIWLKTALIWQNRKKELNDNNRIDVDWGFVLLRNWVYWILISWQNRIVYYNYNISKYTIRRRAYVYRKRERAFQIEPNV